MIGRAVDIALGVATVAASASVDLKSAFGAERFSKFGYGWTGTILIGPNGAANQVGNIETSDDNTAWGVAQAYVAADGPRVFNVLLKRYIRVNNTSGTTGKTNFQLL